MPPSTPPPPAPCRIPRASVGSASRPRALLRAHRPTPPAAPLQSVAESLAAAAVALARRLVHAEAALPPDTEYLRAAHAVTVVDLFEPQYPGAATQLAAVVRFFN